MRIGLTAKLLVVLGLTSAVSVLAMGLAASWSFQHGFLDYLGHQELKRVEPLKVALLHAYDEFGSWDFLKRDPGAWPRLIGRALAPRQPDSHQGQRRLPGTAGQAFSRTPSQGMGPPGVPLQPGIHGAQGFPPPGAPPPGPYGGPPFDKPYGPDLAPPSSGPESLPQSSSSQFALPPSGPDLALPQSDREFVPPRSGSDFVPPSDGQGFYPLPPGQGFAPPPPGQGFAPPPPGQGFAPPPLGQGFAPPPPGQRFAPPPQGPEGLHGRLRLLDDQGSQVGGRAQETGEDLLISLESDGVVVGWLALSPPPWLEDELARRFNSQHNRSLLWISVGALAISMLLGSIFGEGILRRIRSVATGARRLSNGDYGTRVAPKGRDELTGLAEDFNHLASTLERNEELRRRGMADVSHELRTPVAVARAELDALIDGIRPCTKERLKQLQGRLIALVRLLDDLYDLALSDAGALNYRLAPLNLADIIEATVRETSGAFEDKGIELRVQSDGELPMEGDPGRLRQVLDNLLGNSLRYTDPGGVTQVLATRLGDEIRVSVADTPPGVDPEVLERLFDRFYRVETSRTRAKGGAGLGLAICRNIVEAHRGSISASAAGSGGLEIDIRFPASNQTD